MIHHDSRGVLAARGRHSELEYPQDLESVFGACVPSTRLTCSGTDGPSYEHRQVNAARGAGMDRAMPL